MNKKMVEMERTKTYIKYLERRGFCVLNIKELPADPWEWDDIVQSGIVDAVRAGAQKYKGGPAA